TTRFFFFINQSTAYDLFTELEFSRVLFRSAVPAAGQVVAERRDEAEAGDHYATFGHSRLRLSGLAKTQGRARRPRSGHARTGAGPGDRLPPAPVLLLDVRLDVVDGLLHGRSEEHTSELQS